MLKCYIRGCTSKPIYECIKDDFLIYSCTEHSTVERVLLRFDEFIIEKEKSSLRLLIKKKTDLLNLLAKTSGGIQKMKPIETKIKPKHPSNKFIMNGLVSLRQLAGQKQDRNSAHMYKLAIKALQKYPLPILHPDQGLDLQGLGQASIRALHSMFISNSVKYKNLRKSLLSPEPVVTPISYELTIKLYIDQRETRANSIVEMIESVNIPYAVKTLALGDYIFVAESGEKVFVLDTIIERKSNSDLSSSHFSNHLRDQVRRLKDCQCRSKVLLVEGKCDYSILTEMWFRHSLIVINAANLKRSVDILAAIYAEKAEKFKNSSMMSDFESFEEFQNKHSSSEKAGEVFYRQILEFPGMTVKKLNLFIPLYPTMIDFLRSCKESKELVHQNLLWCGIGELTESALYEFFGMQRLSS